MMFHFLPPKNHHSSGQEEVGNVLQCTLVFFGEFQAHELPPSQNKFIFRPSLLTPLDGLCDIFRRFFYLIWTLSFAM